MPAWGLQTCDDWSAVLMPDRKLPVWGLKTRNQRLPRGGRRHRYRECADDSRSSLGELLRHLPDQQPVKSW